MKLVVGYAPEDRSTAEAVAGICRELAITPVLARRGDWLAHALPAEPGSTDTVLLIASPAAERSWWLPFRVGRAAERRLPLLVFRPVTAPPSPPYLRSATVVEDLGEVREALLRLLEEPPIPAEQAPPS